MQQQQQTDDLLRAALDRIAARRRLPESTYRVQFHKGFTFRDAATVVPHLAALGVTHLYASPYLVARPGSTHGYDVIDHNRLNPELGTEEDFNALLAALDRHGMSHILDTVPNHMGVATNDNAWWNDVLKHGPASRYARHFDIAWEGSPRPELHGKVLLPVLGEHYANVLEKGQLQLTIDGGDIYVSYYDRRFPVDADAETRDFLARNVQALNGKPGDAASFDLLDTLLNEQAYRLTYWRTASDEINYRRFFDINDLAALSMERQEVFDAAHGLIFRLLAEGKLAGLRIDHPDGLYDPKQYFERLQRRYAQTLIDADPALQSLDRDTAEAAIAERRPLYAVAEKILAVDEPLPQEWACHGTSGYDFLNMANGLFIDTANAEAFTRLYHEWTGDDTSFEELVYQKKLLILRISLASELHMLAHQLDRLAQRDRHTRDFTLNGLIDALREIIACFPVYRSYVTDGNVSDADRKHVDAAVAKAIERNPKTDPAAFHFVRDAVLQNYPASFTDEDRAAQVRFAGKFQQVTAPTTAKGIEDTAFYIYNRLISLNEVGGEPAHFGVTPDELHRYFADRQRLWPYALSALSTHDTKRSEDVRARINVLSEIPDEWRQRVEHWGRLNERHKQPAGGRPAPDRNEEYLIYQTLIGAWPLEPYGGDEYGAFVKRIGAYMEKAMREAKVYTSWTNPNADHEQAVQAFITRVLDERESPEFLQDLRAFQRRISHFGLLNSLSQTLLKIAAPGVPDTYQGTELWDFSLVDPDNRRPVDYERRRALLGQLPTPGEGRSESVRELMASKADGRVKLFLTQHALTCRRERAGLFSAGEYLPLEVVGAKREHVFAFARRQGEQWAVVAVPRLLTRLVAERGDGSLPLGPDVWQDTRLVLSPEMSGRPPAQLRDVFTGRGVSFAPASQGKSGASAADLFADVPVALLVSA